MFKNPSEGRLTQVGQCLDLGAQSSGPQGRAQPQLLLLQVEQELPQRVLESEQLEPSTLEPPQLFQPHCLTVHF